MPVQIGRCGRQVKLHITVTREHREACAPGQEAEVQKRTELQQRRVISGVLVGVLSTSEVFLAEVQLFPVLDEVEK